MNSKLNEREILDMAAEAGLLPNTVHSWMLPLKRYTEAVLRSAAVTAPQGMPFITSEQLLEIARKTGLRGYLYGVNATDAREMLAKFVAALDTHRTGLVAVGEWPPLPEPSGYMREVDGRLQYSAGPKMPEDHQRGGGYFTPWAAVFDGLKVHEYGKQCRAASPEASANLIDIEREGSKFWHRNCANHFGGVMKETKREPDQSLMTCLHCGKAGYYPVGGIGRITVAEVCSASPAAPVVDESAKLAHSLSYAKTCLTWIADGIEQPQRYAASALYHLTGRKHEHASTSRDEVHFYRERGSVHWIEVAEQDLESLHSIGGFEFRTLYASLIASAASQEKNPLIAERYCFCLNHDCGWSGLEDTAIAHESKGFLCPTCKGPTQDCTPKPPVSAPEDRRESYESHANTMGGFKGGFYCEHRRQPTEQEIWNAGVASGMRRAATPAPQDQGDTRTLPAVCDGKEQEAFEAFAIKERMDMTVHPLHWLFLNAETNAARQGWRAAINYCNEVATAPQEKQS